jgi:hypothetical protein
MNVKVRMHGEWWFGFNHQRLGFAYTPHTQETNIQVTQTGLEFLPEASIQNRTYMCM